jgi:hypothetical protein
MKFIAFPRFIRFKPDEYQHSYRCVKNYQRWTGYELDVSGIIPGAFGETEKEARDSMLARVRVDIAQFIMLGATVQDFSLIYALEPVSADGFVFAGKSSPVRRLVEL